MRAMILLTLVLIWFSVGLPVPAFHPSYAAQSEPNCAVSDFEILQLSYGSAKDHKYIIGEVINHCAMAYGAQLKVVFRDSEGNVVHVADILLGKMFNIPPDTKFAFEEWDLRPVPFTSFSSYIFQVMDWEH